MAHHIFNDKWQCHVEHEEVSTVMISVVQNIKFTVVIFYQCDNDEMGNASSAAEYNDVKTLPLKI